MAIKLTKEEVNKRLSILNLSLISEYVNTRDYSQILCYCGRNFQTTLKDIFCGHTRSCGCYVLESRENKMMEKIGNKYGRLEVIELLSTENGKKRKCVCLCRCGKTKVILVSDLLSGNTMSCGCLNREITKAIFKETRKLQFGKTNPNYNHNITNGDKTDRRTLLNYIDWRKGVYNRDNYACQICGDNSGGKLNAHHMDGFAWRISRRFDISNGVCLCKQCHADFHNKYGQIVTEEQFKEYRELLNAK